MSQKKKLQVLIIVDMQIGFVAAGSPDLISKIEQEIANKQWADVVAVNTDGYGSSTVELPSKTRILWKREDGGGEQVYSYLLGRGLLDVKDGEAPRFVFCGVNASCCVFKTAMGLADRLSFETNLLDSVLIDLRLCGDKARPRVGFLA